MKPIRVTVEVDVKPARKTAALLALLSLMLFLFALAMVVHLACGCYNAKDPTLPDCNTNPEACGEYPSSPSFMHKHAEAGAP